MKIKNYDDLRLAYILLDLAKERRKDDRIITLKREIRTFCNAPLSEKRVIKDDGIDGYIVLFPFADDIQTAEEAKEIFEAYYYIEKTYSYYDCTGKAFTSWYKIIEKNGRFWAYHAIGFDVQIRLTAAIVQRFFYCIIFFAILKSNFFCILKTYFFRF